MEPTHDEYAARLVERARQGDQEAVEELLNSQRPRLRRMVELRLDRRLRARLDPSDVIQDAYLEVAARLPAFLEQPRLPVFLWLRLVVGEQLINAHRRHLGAEMRDQAREVSFQGLALPP